MFGRTVDECTGCDEEIIRCESCATRYAKLSFCVFCTGGRGVQAHVSPIRGHTDEERDVDANGWLSNAIRLLEDPVERPL